MIIYFIRHGETTGDVEDRYGGNYDDHLTGAGKEQSMTLGRQLSGKAIDVIFASPLIRAQETAGILYEFIHAPIITKEDLRERNQYGILTGMLKSEAKVKHPKMVELLKERLNTIESAESYEDFSKRVSIVFDDLVNDSKYISIAIVSHGGPLRVLFRDILKWGEINDIGDCAFVELKKEGETFTWTQSGGFKPSFQIPVPDKK